MSGDEQRFRDKLEAVNSLLDKLIPEVDSGTFGQFKEVPDLIGDRRQNSNLRDELPYMAKNLEGKLGEFVTLLSGNSNRSVTEPNKHNIEKAQTCLTCSESFTSKRKDSKYCSSRCKQIAYRERKESV
jgi:predicted nucleic acid-binding Zn ribbon protein